MHFIGIISYAATGALVALESGYSFIGIFLLGLTTSFGGGIIRNLIIDAPVSDLWEANIIAIVFAKLTIIVLLPVKWVHHWKKWGLLFDSIGLASFALQGALSAKQIHTSFGLVLLSALFTGLGGGMIRDLLAGRKPLALKEEIHAVLTLICGFCVWLNWTHPIQLTLVILSVATIRLLAVKHKWRLRFLSTEKREKPLSHPAVIRREME